MNAAAAPLGVLGGDILGNEDDPGGSSDELILARFGLGRDQRQQGAAVGRGDRHPAVAGLKLRIEGQIEAELIPVESQALLLVSNVDIDRVNAQMRTVYIHSRRRGEASHASVSL